MVVKLFGMKANELQSWPKCFIGQLQTFHCSFILEDIYFFCCQRPINCYLACFCFQGVMEEDGVLSGDNAFNAHFGECISAIGDIDDDGYQGQYSNNLVVETECKNS